MHIFSTATILSIASCLISTYALPFDLSSAEKRASYSVINVDGGNPTKAVCTATATVTQSAVTTETIYVTMTAQPATVTTEVEVTNSLSKSIYDNGLWVPDNYYTYVPVPAISPAASLPASGV